jgi:cytochrome c-type biogenesis protein CcmH/NrfG
MLLLLLLIIVVVALPAVAYVEYCRWRGLVVVEPPVDETNHDPPKPPDTVKRLPSITDVGT